ncbi:MAG: cystathionine beta-lyase [Parvibaculum sp.]|jgi:cystathionine beta-lyase|nr:cystathionine beta-lyase [Parvibaculum sp.]
MTKKKHQDTTIVTTGRDPHNNHGVINPPVYHASTILYPSVDALHARDAKVTYGRRGTPTTFAFQDAIAELEGGYRSLVTPSGLSACSIALLAHLKAGDHVLVTDSVYGPTRTFCDVVLKRYGIDVEYYDPVIGPGIANLLRPETTVVYTEAPGSQTFEMQDIPAIANAAHKAGALAMMDNTWASPLFCNPFVLGVDVSIQAATKYIVGHSDVMMGTITTNESAWRATIKNHGAIGITAGPDDIYLALRGLRTLSVRLHRHMETGILLAKWLEDRPEVSRVLHPALPTDPGHEIWKRDFSGACGLFGIVLKPVSAKAVAAMLDNLELFGMGYSWGGYESLIIPADPASNRTATKWAPEGPLIRIHAGLEDPQDLIADLEAGFERLAKHS